MKRAALLIFLLLPSSCISVVWERDRWHRPPVTETVNALQEGVDLESCLDALGAPLRVWQVGSGYALSWAWYDSKELSYRLTVPLGQSASTSLRYTNVGQDTEGLLLFFDAKDKLVLVERGFLKDMMSEEEERSPAPPMQKKGEAKSS